LIVAAHDPLSKAPVPVCVSVQEADFSLDAECTALRQPGADGRFDVGAVASFVGTVRGGADGVQAMWLEHYPGMTERAIETMCDEAARRFDVRALRVIHRVGRLLPGEQIVLVAVASAHRREAFQACEFLMDYLKTQAPFWKKETTAEGERWVDARVQDDAALARWGLQVPGNA
jgi:molybdopterin synthase catalytic subunit